MNDAGKEWVLDRLRELDTRLAVVRGAVSTVPVVPAAAISRPALAALEAGIRRSSAALRRELAAVLDAAERIPSSDRAALRGANKKLALLQLRADGLFTTFDLLQDATAIRCDAETGLMLRGIDVLIEHALRRRIPGYVAPLAISYLDSSGRGGAIARARTRLPGGFVLPAALVRVSPESMPLRLSSVLHESGHQLSVDLHLLEEARAALRDVVENVARDRALGRLYSTWHGELMADLWGIVLCGGAPAVDGLQRVLSLPEQLLYAVRRNAPHPPGPVRVAFADAACRLLYPDPSLDALKARFDAIYGDPVLDARERRRFAGLLAATPAAAEALLRHRFEGLGGRTLPECGERSLVAPRRVRALLRRHRRSGFAKLGELPPLHALAVLGFARVVGDVSIPKLHDVSAAWLRGIAEQSYRRASGSQATSAPAFHETALS